MCLGLKAIEKGVFTDLLLYHGCSVSLFVEDEVDPFDPLKTIYDFIQFVDRLCVVALQVSQVNVCNK